MVYFTLLSITILLSMTASSTLDAKHIAPASDGWMMYVSIVVSVDVVSATVGKSVIVVEFTVVEHTVVEFTVVEFTIVEFTVVEFTVVEFSEPTGA